MGKKPTEIDALRTSLNVVFDKLTYHKIMHWVHKAGNDEVSGVGKIIRDGSTLRVVDAIMLKQENSAGGTDIDPIDLANAEFDLKDSPGDLRFWWHSHVKMSCFWSHQDITTLELLGRHGWFVATVLNQNWERRSAVYFGNGIDLFVDELPTKHVFQMPEVISSPWDEEFKANVIVKPAFPIMTKGYVTDAVQGFKEWRNKLSKRERRIISRPGNGPESTIVGIFETKRYGKVMWTAQDEQKWTKFVTPVEKPQVQVNIHRNELLRDITKVRYADPFVTAALVFHGSQTWCENEVLKDFAKKHVKPALPSKSIIRLPACGAQHEETEREMRRIYGSEIWDAKSDDEKDEYCELWESGRWPWANERADGFYRGND